MNKLGFTLTEILAVIVLMAVISLIAYSATNAVQKNINQKLYQTTLEEIEKGAKDYGEDNEAKITNQGVTISIDELIKKKYIPVKKVDYNSKMGNITNAYCDNNNKCSIIVDNRKNMDEEGYILNY